MRSGGGGLLMPNPQTAVRAACTRGASARRPSPISRPRIVNEPLDMFDGMLALAGAEASLDHPFDGKDMWRTIAATARLRRMTSSSSTSKPSEEL